MSEVPLTLDELKAGLGRYILLARHKQLDWTNEAGRHAIHHIAVAEKWHKMNPEEMQAIGAIANRALVYLPGDMGTALVLLISDFTNDLCGARRMSVTDRYMLTVFGHLPEQSPDDLEKYLKTIVAFGQGE